MNDSDSVLLEFLTIVSGVFLAILSIWVIWNWVLPDVIHRPHLSFANAAWLWLSYRIFRACA